MKKAKGKIGMLSEVKLKRDIWVACIKFLHIRFADCPTFLIAPFSTPINSTLSQREGKKIEEAKIQLNICFNLELSLQFQSH